MARRKSPKKNADLKPSVSIPSTTPASDLDGAPVQLAAATPAVPEMRNPEMKNTNPRKTTRKPEIVKAEPRSNLLPINLEDEIRSLAYLMSERRGFQAGHETEDWLAAEREVLQRYAQHSA